MDDKRYYGTNEAVYQIEPMLPQVVIGPDEPFTVSVDDATFDRLTAPAPAAIPNRKERRKLAKFLRLAAKNRGRR